MSLQVEPQSYHAWQACNRLFPDARRASAKTATIRREPENKENQSPGDAKENASKEDEEAVATSKEDNNQEPKTYENLFEDDNEDLIILDYSLSSP